MEFRQIRTKTERSLISVFLASLLLLTSLCLASSSSASSYPYLRVNGCIITPLVPQNTGSGMYTEWRGRFEAECKKRPSPFKIKLRLRLDNTIKDSGMEEITFTVFGISKRYTYYTNWSQCGGGLGYPKGIFSEVIAPDGSKKSSNLNKVGIDKAC
jgi:hypothetical protein